MRTPNQSFADDLITALQHRCRELLGEVHRLQGERARRAVEKYYSVPETALLLSFSARWVRDQVRAGALERVVRIGRDLRIPASSINRMVEQWTAPDGPGIGARTEGELRRRMAGRREVI